MCFGSTPPAGHKYAAAPPIVDTCPAFAPPTHQHWKRERGRTMVGIANTATTSQILAKIIAALPHPSERAGLSHMEQTSNCSGPRTLQSLMDILGERYRKTDSARSWSWLNRFAEFARHPSGHFGDFWSRFLRETTLLGTLGMQMPDGAQFPKSHVR